MQLISMAMHLRVVNGIVAHHNNNLVGETITVQATLFKCFKKVHMFGWTIAYTKYKYVLS